ncbi:MAG: lipoyl(octanoyl) transferase LipB [Chitinophagales bacterium]
MDTTDRSAIRLHIEKVATHYRETEILQQQWFDQNITAKLAGHATQNTLIICEHQPVYTLGKSGKLENLLFDPERVGAALMFTNRGGDITFHGPGQLVAYPIFDLDTLNIGVASFVSALEEIVIRTIAEYGLSGNRIDGASGVWLTDGAEPRKICAVGLKVSRLCTMHGIAINVNTDLKFFSYIVPCGLPDKGVTSLAKELGQTVDFEHFKDRFIHHFLNFFHP